MECERKDSAHTISVSRRKTCLESRRRIGANHCYHERNLSRRGRHSEIESLLLTSAPAQPGRSLRPSNLVRNPGIWGYAQIRRPLARDEHNCSGLSGPPSVLETLATIKEQKNPSSSASHWFYRQVDFAIAHNAPVTLNAARAAQGPLVRSKHWKVI